MNTSFPNWNFNVLPDSFQVGDIELLKSGSPATASVSKNQVRYQAFSVGFFGFHYIRASIENEISLCRDSLRILTRLLMEYEVETVLLKELKSSENRSYPDYWGNVLKKISLALGDSLGPEVQRIVELGFQMAAINTCLVGVLKDNDSRGLPGQLRILKDWMSKLLRFAKRTRIPEMLQEPLVESIYLLRRSKTRKAAYESMKIFNVALSSLLLTVDT